MLIKDPRIRALLRQAERVESGGKRMAAEEIYRQILAESPATAAAWAGLGRVVQDKEEKEIAYEKALELDPDDLQSKVGLAQVRGEPVPDEWIKALEPDLELAPEPEPEPVIEEDPAAYELFCYRHPERSTSLRCYNCDRPICTSCANKTSVGYLCPECIRDLEDKYYNARATDYLIAALVSFPLSLIAGFLVWRISGGIFFIFIMIFAGGFVGSLIGRITKRAIGGRRGRYIPHLVVGMMVLGVILPVAPLLLGSGPAALAAGASMALTLITPGVYLFVAGGAAYYWMK